MNHHTTPLTQVRVLAAQSNFVTKLQGTAAITEVLTQVIEFVKVHDSNANLVNRD